MLPGTRGPLRERKTRFLGISRRGRAVYFTRGSKQSSTGGMEKDALRTLRRRAARVRCHAPGHAASLDQLPRKRGVLRDHLEHRRRLLVLSRRPPTPPDSLPLQQRSLRSGRALPLPPRLGFGRVLVALLAADPPRARGLRVPARDGLHDHRLAPKRDRDRDAVLRPRRREPRDLAHTGHQQAQEHEAKLSLFSAVEFCLWDAWDDQTNFQRNFSTGQVEVEDGVIYHKTEYRERRDHFAYFACSEPLAGFDTQRDTFLGAYRGWDNPAAVERGESFDSVAYGWAPCGSHHVELTLAPGETKEIVFVLGYWENPVDAKFDPEGSQTINKKLVKPVIERYLSSGEVESAFQHLRDYWSDLLGILQVSTPGRAHQPHGQHLERLPVHGHLQHVPLGLVLRVGDRARHGLPRLQPGPARLRAHGSGAGARADSRHRRHPASLGRRLPPVPAADQARQQRHRLGLQRRPGLADPRRRGLSQGDRRHLDPRRGGHLRQRARLGVAPLRASAALAPLHACTGSARTACR